MPSVGLRTTPDRTCQTAATGCRSRIDPTGCDFPRSNRPLASPRARDRRPTATGESPTQDADAVHQAGHYRGDTLPGDRVVDATVVRCESSTFMPPRTPAPTSYASRRALVGFRGDAGRREAAVGLRPRRCRGYGVTAGRRDWPDRMPVAAVRRASVGRRPHDVRREYGSRNDRAWFVLTWHPSHHTVPRPTTR